jgi:NAD(P)H-hydrate epimerase
VAGLSDVEKMAIVQEAAAELGTTILLKGQTDIISNGKDVALSSTGNAYMTIGGTGDTLAGICGSLAARGLDLFTVAQAAAFLNGKAGELASQNKKDGMIVTDVIEAIPEILNF